MPSLLPWANPAWNKLILVHKAPDFPHQHQICSRFSTTAQLSFFPSLLCPPCTNPAHRGSAQPIHLCTPNISLSSFGKPSIPASQSTAANIQPQIFLEEEREYPLMKCSPGFSSSIQRSQPDIATLCAAQGRVSSEPGSVLGYANVLELSAVLITMQGATAALGFVPFATFPYWALRVELWHPAFPACAWKMCRDVL